MKFGKTAKAVAIAVAVGMSSHVMAASTNQWWSFDFDAVPSITALTNAEFSSIGLWSTADGDESSIATIPEHATTALKLDTQGNNLTWKPNTASTSTVVLVDADIYLVGSDTAPTGFDMDGLNPVQTAVYLKNYVATEGVDEGKTTNSVLCAYVADTESANKWVELQGTMIDTNWYSLRIEVDYSALVPVAKFIVGGIVMQDSAAKNSFEIANYKKFNTEGLQKVNSVSFRGTGAVDNFVANQVVPTPAALLNFTVKTFTDNVLDISLNGSVDPGTSVTEGAMLTVSFNEADAATTTKYLTAVRVYTNEAFYVDYNATYNAPGWNLDSPLTFDSETFVVNLAIDTTGFTAGYMIEAYYGADPVVLPGKTVAFNANGGTGSMTAQYSETTANLTKNTFTYTGYTFTGWNTASDGIGGTAYADEASYDFSANMTLYAQWTADTPTDDVTFDVGGANLVFTSIDIVGTTATVGFTADGTVNASPATLWISVTETLGGDESAVEVEATVTSPEAGKIEGTFTIPATPDTRFINGISTANPAPAA